MGLNSHSWSIKIKSFVPRRRMLADFSKFLCFSSASWRERNLILNQNLTKKHDLLDLNKQRIYSLFTFEFDQCRRADCRGRMRGRRVDPCFCERFSALSPFKAAPISWVLTAISFRQLLQRDVIKTFPSPTLKAGRDMGVTCNVTDAQRHRIARRQLCWYHLQACNSLPLCCPSGIKQGRRQGRCDVQNEEIKSNGTSLSRIITVY